ncbi:hypothetical protein GPK74_09225 [Coprococcus catus]|nr:hypothetical protein [Coprococcus catus]
MGTNPVIVRKILQQLKVAGLIEVARGTGGVTILRMRDYIITISGVFFVCHNQCKTFKGSCN